MATPVAVLIAVRGMKIMRTPVAGQGTAVAVPGFADGVTPGSWTVTFVAVPLVMTRMWTPFTPKLDSAMVSDAVGVMGAGVVPVGRTDCDAWSAIRRTPFYDG
ncbi:hypothetical protein ACGFIY_21370 [Micromonospora chersina]|uniref:hypothetical protein n=1 Tax=Micromonospora chersina TaxID=47854 RepID=UPI00371EF2A8